MNKSWNLSVDNSNRTKTNWNVKNCCSERASANRAQTEKLQQEREIDNLQNYCLGTTYAARSRSPLCRWPRSAGEPCACREKFVPRPIFKIFLLDQIRVDQEKKEVRKRRASIYRCSPSDAVDYFLVSHVTGWAILGYPALELDTGIFPLILCFFFVHSLAAKFKFEFKKKCHTGKASLVQGVQVLVWFSFGNSSAWTAKDPCAFLQVVQVDGAKVCGFDPRRSATFHTVDRCKKAVSACLARRTCSKAIHALATVLLSLKWDWPWAHGGRSGKFDDPHEVEWTMRCRSCPHERQPMQNDDPWCKWKPFL